MLTATLAPRSQPVGLTIGQPARGAKKLVGDDAADQARMRSGRQQGETQKLCVSPALPRAARHPTNHEQQTLLGLITNQKGCLCCTPLPFVKT